MVLTNILYRTVRFKTRKLRIKSITFTAMIADSIPKLMLGLMHRQGIKGNECMLFIFKREGNYGIWMLNMKFPIDIVWINSSGMVVSVVHSAVPCKGMFSCHEHTPSSPAKYVLEFKAGTAKRLGLKVNDQICL